MGGKEVDDWAMYNQISMKHEAPHQKASLVERHNVLIRPALQRAEAQCVKGSLCVSVGAVFGLVTFMHNPFTFINNHPSIRPYQAGSQAYYPRSRADTLAILMSEDRTISPE